jgi:hypothetical protein
MALSPKLGLCRGWYQPESPRLVTTGVIEFFYQLGFYFMQVSMPYEDVGEV